MVHLTALALATGFAEAIGVNPGEKLWRAVMGICLDTPFNSRSIRQSCCRGLWKSHAHLAPQALGCEPIPPYSLDTVFTQIGRTRHHNHTIPLDIPRITCFERHGSPSARIPTKISLSPGNGSTVQNSNLFPHSKWQHKDLY